jgi:hypothetical protein
LPHVKWSKDFFVKVFHYDYTHFTKKNVSNSVKKIIIIVCVCFLANGVFAQNLLRRWTLPYRDTIVFTDSLTIIPSSLSVSDSTFLPLSNFIFSHNTLIFKEKYNRKNIIISYRVLPYRLEKTFVHLDSTNARPEQKDAWKWEPYKDPKANNFLPDSKGLDYNGSFSRGISVGNNQDLVVNSNFNLQMTGKLSSDIEVAAAITDNNIPIQPDGNTAQLNQFDRIFINVKRKNMSLTAGDFELQKPNSYFMNYFKRVQGLSFSYSDKLKKGRTVDTKAAVAVSKGKFARQIISAIEGNQGPYRLQGANGERFVIIVASTEKIYLDGNLAKRGLENEYVIDYNQGTLTFTPKVLVKRELRIVAEFEYNDQNYVRTMYASDATLTFPRGRVYFNLYGEQDSRGSGAQGNLRASDKALFTSSGDAVEGVLANGVDTIPVFDKDKILYRQVIDAQGNTHFEFSQNKDSAKYALRFVEIYDGKGEYILKQSAANGRVYEYVGVGKGNFSVGTKLNTPKLLQLYTFGTDYQLFKKKNATLKAEIALSNRDNNRFSSKDDADNFGTAAFLSYQQNYVWKKKWKMGFNANYEGSQARFQALNPYRSVEFSRDWNVESQVRKSAEQFFKSGFSIKNDSLGALQYEFNQLQQLGSYQGSRHTAFLQVEKKNWWLSSSANYLTTTATNENTTFFRPKIEIRKSFKNKLSIGFLAEREKNERYITDTLARNSFYYDLWKTYVQLPSSKTLQWTAFYQERTDYFPLKNTFVSNIFSKEINSNLQYRGKKGFSIGGNIAYRNLTIGNEKWTTQKPQETYLGRIDASLSKWKNLLYAQTSYELGSGQEQRIEYFYQKIESGKGNFTWRDVNKDDKIQQDEIFPVVFQDSANVVRFILPTNQFIRTNNLTISQVANFSPKNLWAKDTTILKKILCRFATESALQVQRKVKIGAAVSPWNPFEQLSITDTSLVAYSTNIRNILYFNRNNILYDLQLGSTDNSSRSILTTGFDIRRQREDFFKIRWNVSRRVMFRAGVSKNLKATESEFFPNRNFSIYTYATDPELNWQPTRDFRLRIAYKYSQSIDTLGAKETAFANDINAEVTYNQSAKTSIRTKFSLVNIAYDGAKNSPVQYAMLNGLQNGKNFLWGLQLNQALNKTLQLELRYEGRKTGDVRIIHTGNMAIRAVF